MKIKKKKTQNPDYDFFSVFLAVSFHGMLILLLTVFNLWLAINIWILLLTINAPGNLSM